MSELEPFFDSCDDFERGLLRSVRTDAPAANAAVKTMAALGLDQAALAASAGTHIAAGTLVARYGSVLTVLKGLGVGLLLGFVTMGAAGWFSQRPSAESRHVPHALVDQTFETASGSAPLRPAEPPRAESAAAPPIALRGLPKSLLGAQLAAPRAAARAADASNSSAEPPSAAQAGSGALPASLPEPSGSGVPGPPSAVSIAEQVKVIDHARNSLKRGRASDALGSVNAYVQRWPNGALTIEATIVRIEAELALYDRPAAERDARAVIAALPGSRYATRVRALFAPPLAERDPM